MGSSKSLYMCLICCTRSTVHGSIHVCISMIIRSGRGFSRSFISCAHAVDVVWIMSEIRAFTNKLITIKSISHPDTTHAMESILLYSLDLKHMIFLCGPGKSSLESSNSVWQNMDEKNEKTNKGPYQLQYKINTVIIGVDSLYKNSSQVEPHKWA